MKQKRAAIYTRVSTLDQKTDGQEAELLEYAGNRGWSAVVYCDHGYSGAKDRRPALDQMLSDIRKRRIDLLIVWSLDRLARSLRQLLSIAEECRCLGVDLVCIKQNVDTTSAVGILLFQLLGAIAEFERELIRERVKAGIAHARRAGKSLGRPPLRRFSRDEVKELQRLREKGASIRGLAIKFATTQYLVSKLVGEHGRSSENQMVSGGPKP